VCIAPSRSTRILTLCKAGRWDEAMREREAFLPLEDCRDALSPIRVLHEAVTLAGIADMGPMLPMLSNLADGDRARVRDAARALREHDAQPAAS
jgi:dihydrodipicolinate synthase/N-acetylneuraminate lyase